MERRRLAKQALSALVGSHVIGLLAILAVELLAGVKVPGAWPSVYFGLVWALIGYSMTRGRRDFVSVSQVVATRYEVLTEHKLAQRARDLLHQRPGAPLT